VKQANLFAVLSIVVLAAVLGSFSLKPVEATAIQPIRIFIDGQELHTDVQPLIVNNRTMVPVRHISEALGMQVTWDDVNRWVIISSPAIPVSDSNLATGEIDWEIAIMGNSVASSDDLKAVLKSKNPEAPEDLVDLYLEIGKEYGIRGDIAFCQAAKETGWWKFGGLVRSAQNNYCGLGATGKPATGNEGLNGADPSKVWYEEGAHGAFFDSPASGVEAHIQHLYAYACKKPLPDGKILVDPRFNLVSRGSTVKWSDLDGKWAVPGNGYGASILQDYYQLVLLVSSNSPGDVDRVKQLEIENQLLRIENEKLKNEKCKV